MPNRIIKESICVSESIDSLTWFEEVLFYRLIVNCDDYGRFDGRVPVVKNRLFPLKDNVTAKAVKDGINKLASAGLVRMYECDGKPFLYLPTWNDHQSVRAKRSRYPAPDDNAIAHESICNHVHANVPVIQSESESESVSESNANDGNRKRFAPPTVDDVRAYCQLRGNNVDPQRFVDYYTSNGWMVGKNKMKSWEAAVRTWEQKRFEQHTPAHGGSEAFDAFWATYPKQIAQTEASAAWVKVATSQDIVNQIMAGLENWKHSDQWKKGGGQFIPKASKFLLDGYWRSAPIGAVGRQLDEDERAAILRLMDQEF